MTKYIQIFHALRHKEDGSFYSGKKAWPARPRMFASENEARLEMKKLPGNFIRVLEITMRDEIFYALENPGNGVYYSERDEFPTYPQLFHNEDLARLYCPADQKENYEIVEIKLSVLQ